MLTNSRRWILPFVCAAGAVAAALLAGPVSTASAAASLTPLGDLLGGGMIYSLAHGVSSDGSVVVGTSRSDSGQEAFRWTSDGGMVGLGHLPGGRFSSEAYGVSDDGSVIVGGSDSGSGYEAFRWTSDGGILGLGKLPRAVGSWALGVSGDGSVVVGANDRDQFREGDEEAFRWTSDGGMVGLGHLPSGTGSGANGVSTDGSVIVGYSGSAFGHQAFRWTSDGGMMELPGGINSVAWGVSADGSVVVGASVFSASHGEASRWTSDGDMVGLGHLPGGVYRGVANGVSGDGSVVVGYNNLDPGLKAFYWTADGGMRELWDVLLSHGVDPAADGWTELSSVRDITPDGDTIVGYGIRNNNQEAFVAVIPNAPLAGDFNNDCNLDVSDIDALTEDILTGGMGEAFDLNGDGTVDGTDRVVWINQLKGTFLGDSNLDGEFNTSDLVDVFAAGQYEDGIEGNSTWSTGDWDGTADFDTRDLVAAFAEGAYEQGPMAPAVAAVPEPSSLIGLFVAIGGWCVFIRQRLG
jgi:probable HAF family extracellular repeat protein